MRYRALIALLAALAIVGSIYAANSLDTRYSVASTTVGNSAAYEASHVIKATPGTLIALVGYNSKGSAQFIQIFNAAAVPADTAVPLLTFTVAASSNFSVTIPICGLPCDAGICWSNSSTGSTKTIGSADVFATWIYQ